jgi:hypothetical protein
LLCNTLRSGAQARVSTAVLAVLFCLPSIVLAGERSWVERSDRNSAIVFEVLGGFAPEYASDAGAERFDIEVLDLRPRRAERYDRAAARALVALTARRKTETDPRVRHDLDILIEAVGRMRRTQALEHRLLIPYLDLPRSMFQGLQLLLDARNKEARQRNALRRLQRYAGMEPGVTPLAELARARMSGRVGKPGLIWPYEGEVRQGVENCDRYVAGIADLFRSSVVRDWEPAHARLAAQVREYCDWLKASVLPRARKDHKLPPELYADRLRSHGVDIDPEQAIAMGTFAFAEIRDEIARIAARIARERNLASADYRDVLRELKRNQIPADRVLAHYKGRLKEIEDIIVRERIVTLPKRAASIRLASEAESAAGGGTPYMNLPRLVGNQGEVGEFVLPLTNPNAQSSAVTDDATSDGSAWPWTAHEARPGHELQFDAMVDQGVSIARAVFAFNSVNAEGWGLYAESIMIPHIPLEGQLFSLQLRLLRASRAFLDPMVNLGRMTPAEAKAFLMREVVLSDPFAQQEADRYAFDLPGQAVSYYYGYTRIRQLRVKAELALGKKFDQQKFHDLVLAQGLLPPKLLERAVMEEITRSW